jgi:transmembrane 9 superfamily protein 2/4
MRAIVPAPAIGALLLAQTASCFYLPGVTPHEYREGERVELKVNKLTSTKTQ